MLYFLSSCIASEGEGVANDSVILEEEIDPNYVPGESEGTARAGYDDGFHGTMMMILDELY